MEPFLCNSFPIKNNLHNALHINLLFTSVKAKLNSVKKYFNNYHPLSGLKWQKTNASLLFWVDDLIMELNRKLAYETLTLRSLQKCAIT